MAGLISDEDLRKGVLGYRIKYVEGGPVNPLGKSYRNFTARDIERLEPNDLGALRNMMLEEKYTITDAMLPNGMQRADFMRAILRGLAKNNVAQEIYSGFGKDTPNLMGRTINVDRSPYITGKELKPQRVTEDTSIVAIRDGFIDILLNNSRGVRLAKDVSQSVGLNETRMLPLENDAEAYDFGYVVGFMPNFKKENGLQLSVRIEPAPEQAKAIDAYVLKATAGKTAQEIERLRPQIQAEINKMSLIFNQTNYCNVVDGIFEPGRSQDNRSAMLLGYAQARTDSSAIPTDANRSYDRVGLSADCPAPAKRAAQR